MEFTRPGPFVGSFQIAATTRIFFNASGAKCIRAGGVSRCSNDTPLQGGRLIHGGVELVVNSTQHNTLNSSFVFELNNDFVPGSYSVKALAEDTAR